MVLPVPVGESESESESEGERGRSGTACEQLHRAAISGNQLQSVAIRGVVPGGPWSNESASAGPSLRS